MKNKTYLFVFSVDNCNKTLGVSSVDQASAYCDLLNYFLSLGVNADRISVTSIDSLPVISNGQLR